MFVRRLIKSSTTAMFGKTNSDPLLYTTLRYSDDLTRTHPSTFLLSIRAKKWGGKDSLGEQRHRTSGIE
ncbi:hypothetical protein T05_8300 [Trichinella murrelli]|uniref:Uncharacterized protein n=1 Tax=Trichinella murrelli TaxID=144512 RepID=A0A0V0U4S8_9BILA|nr:hypothetical protein T05_8300 [Trichinella murrelli]